MRKPITRLPLTHLCWIPGLIDIGEWEYSALIRSRDDICQMQQPSMCLDGKECCGDSELSNSETHESRPVLVVPPSNPGLEIGRSALKNLEVLAQTLSCTWHAVDRVAHSYITQI
jgi:hypothetical protein